MKELKNPFEKIPGYYCFGCSSKNHNGLRMTFSEDGDEIICKWEPERHFQGYLNVLHGGIQSTLMDEIASWVVFIKLKSGGVTSRLTTRFRKPVMVNKGPIEVRAHFVEMKRNIAIIDVKLYNSERELCSESVAEYYVFSKEKAEGDMDYPGIESFF